MSLGIVMLTMDLKSCTEHFPFREYLLVVYRFFTG